MDETTFTAADGVELFYRPWPTTGTPNAVVVIAHGASEHSGRYDRFARVLNDNGCAVFAIDHRGHGRTASSSGPGRLGGGTGERLVDDLHELVSRANDETPGRPIILFGHSMGAMIAQAYVTRFRGELAGYVLSGCPGPMEGGDELVSGLQAAVDAGMADETLDMLGPFNESFEPARTKYDWLSRDASEVDAYVNDPLCGDDMPLTYGFVVELLKLALPAMSPDAIATIPALPVLLITGEMDPVSGMAAQVRVLEPRLRDAGLDVTAHYYPDARHEVLNETNRDEVHADVTAWIKAVTSTGH